MFDDNNTNVVSIDLIEMWTNKERGVEGSALLFSKLV